MPSEVDLAKRELVKLLRAARLEETDAFLGGPPRAWGALSEDTAPPARALGSCFGSEKSRTCNPLQPDSGWSECKYDFLHPQGSRQGVRGVDVRLISPMAPPPPIESYQETPYPWFRNR